MPESHGVEMAELAVRHFRRAGDSDIHGSVLAFDVVGDEGSFPMSQEADPMVKGRLEINSN